MKSLLSITYFGPVQWYQRLHRSECVLVERHETFQKQTYRNRCTIATANGLQTLSVPVGHNHAATPISTMGVSSHGHWQHQHWQALCSAYGESPFFDYYADDLLPFFQPGWNHLFDLDMAITHKLCELLDIHPRILYTDAYHPDGLDGYDDCRAAIHPKHPQPDALFHPRPYYQVYRHRYPFQPNLSILDLLFNMGNEAIFYL